MSLSNIVFIDASIYQGDRLILSDINIEIKKGEFVYLIGKVGSGKSSFIKTIHGELSLLEGSAEVLGYRMEHLSKKDRPFLRRKIGVVFQDFQLLTDRNVHDNLAFVLEATGWESKEDINIRITEVLDKVNLIDKEYEMPNRLSGGEQQRVVLARALLNDPHIILADEPTGNIDPESSEGIMAILKEIRGNDRTVIMATHDYALIKHHDARILKFDNGKILEYDSIDQLKKEYYMPGSKYFNE